MPKLSTSGRNAAANAVRDQIDGGSGAGTIKIYTGSQPANPQSAATGTLLGTLTLSDPCAPSASNGVLTFSAITQDSSADNTGTAGWARIADSAGTAVLDGNVTTTGGGGMIELNTTSIVAGGPISITAFTLTMPE